MKIKSDDYLTKQLSPLNEYVRKSERYNSKLPFKLAMSGRSNHVKHVDFNYTQVFYYVNLNVTIFYKLLN